MNIMATVRKYHVLLLAERIYCRCYALMDVHTVTWSFGWGGVMCKFGDLRSEVGLGPNMLFMFFSFSDVRLFVDLSINHFRPNPIPAANISQSFGFNVKIFRCSPLTGGPNPLSAATRVHSRNDGQCLRFYVRMLSPSAISFWRGGKFFLPLFRPTVAGRSFSKRR
jgi:hypothetical protein